MFDRILSVFRSGTVPATPMPEKDARHDLGALRVRVAKADRASLFEEIEQIDRLLAGQFDLNPVEAARMRAECEKLEEALPGTDEIAGILHAAVSEADREAAVRSFWRVVFADGQRHRAEESVLSLIERTLDVSHDRSRALTADATSSRTA